MTMKEGNMIEFDFLGKDSMRYQNEVQVDPKVWKNMESFLRDPSGSPKGADEQVPRSI